MAVHIREELHAGVYFYARFCAVKLDSPDVVFYIYVENDFHYQALVFTKDITGKQLDIWLGLDTTLIPEECVFRLIIDTTDTDIETEEWKTVKQALIEL